MKIEIGKTVTATLPVDIVYQCSACGKENLDIQTINGSAYTPSIIGINLDRNVSENAKTSLHENIDSLLNQENIHRFQEAKFSCKCRFCGHEEPWTRMHYDELEGVNKGSFNILWFSGLAMVLSMGCAPIFPISLVVFLISTAICVGIKIHKIKNNKQMEQLILELPKESLPTILPYSAERHDIFKQKIKELSDEK